jgi:O-antigen/teichoic acid export membrane protein
VRAKRSRTFLFSVGYKVVVVALGVVTSVIISRALLPQGRGSYYVYVSLATLTMSLGHLSVEQAEAYLWSDGADPHALRANSLVLGLAAGIVSALVAAAVVLLLGPATIPLASPYLLWLALAAVPIGTVNLFASGLVYLQGRLLAINAAAAVAAVVQCASVVVLRALSSLTVASVLAVWVVSFAIPVIAVLLVTRPRLANLDWPLMLRTLKIGLRYHVGMTSLFLLLRLDTLLLNGMSSKAQVGLYSLAVTVAEMIYLVTDTVAKMALPGQMSGSFEQCADHTSFAVGISIVLSIVAFVLLAVAAPWVVPTLYGRAFRGSVPMLWWLGPGVVALAISRPAGALLLRVDEPMKLSILVMAAAAMNVGLNVLLIPRYRGIGASIASSVTYLLLAAAYLAWMHRATGRHWSAFRPRPVAIVRLVLMSRADAGT